MNTLIIKLLFKGSKLLRGMEFLISWLSCRMESFLLRASLKLQGYALNKLRSKSKQIQFRQALSHLVSRSQHTQKRDD